MQVKLWTKNESGLKKLIKQTPGADGLLSISKLANWAIAEYIVARQNQKLKKP